MADLAHGAPKIDENPKPINTPESTKNENRINKLI